MAAFQKDAVAPAIKMDPELERRLLFPIKYCLLLIDQRIEIPLLIVFEVNKRHTVYSCLTWLFVCCMAVCLSQGYTLGGNGIRLCRQWWAL